MRIHLEFLEVGSGFICAESAVESGPTQIPGCPKGNLLLFSHSWGLGQLPKLASEQPPSPNTGGSHRSVSTYLDLAPPQGPERPE